MPTTSRLRRVAVLATTVAIAGLFSAPDLAAQDRSAFDKELVKIRALMDKGKWSSAGKRLDTLLEEHAGANYVLTIAEELVEDLKRCTFHEAHPTPELEDLVSGELSWNPRTGKLKLLYEDDDRSDFVNAQGSSLWFHPVLFDGPYTITVEGKRLGVENGGLRIAFGTAGNVIYTADFGYQGGQSHVPMALRRFEGKTDRTLDKRHSSAVSVGKPFKLALRVTANRMEMKVGGRTILKADRDPDEEWGQFGINGVPFEKLRIDGKVEPAWLQGLVDAEQQAAQKAFEERWPPQDAVPDWLATAAANPAAADDEEEMEKLFPGTVTMSELRWLVASMQMLGEGKFDEMLERHAAASDDDAPDAARAFIEARVLLALGRCDEALTAIDRAARPEPDWWRVHELRADALSTLRRFAEAEAELRAGIEATPQEGGLYNALALLLLARDRRTDAEEVLADARAAKATGTDLVALGTMLRMADKGPSWPRVHEFESKHYVIASDIDRDTCREAARILENAYVMYQSQLDWVRESDKPKRFRVYLFSGLAGYESYCSQILGSAPAHTAGLYSPTLKQLLIWNLPDRDQMMRTVRHEGFHQYLDRVLDDAPIWLNEGLAEFYETARREGGRNVGGQLRPDHLEVLARRAKSIVPLERFVGIGRGAFYSDMAVHYAEGWALVHFLRESSSTNRQRFQTLFAELQSDAPSSTAIEAAFADVDWTALDAEFRIYLDGLRQKVK